MTLISEAPPKPGNYGEWWNTNEKDQSWYQELFDYRPNAHRFFMDWFGGLIRRGEEVRSLLEVGCGRAIPYADYFKTVDYSGTDISEKEITYCRGAYAAPGERFFVSDVVASPPARRYDVVFSHAVIDHVYDVNAFLTNLAACTARHLYVSAYRSWMPDLAQHRYYWSEPVTCYHNDVSPAETRMVLARAGFGRVEVFPVFSGRWDMGYPMETVVIASR